MKFIVCLLFPIAAFSQTKPLEFKIDSIKTTNLDNKEREFIISYHITNLTDKAVSFVLNTKTVTPISWSSLRPNPYYKIYENDKSFDANGLLSNKDSQIYFKSEKDLQKYQDSIEIAIKNKTLDQLLQEAKDKILSNIQKLEPKQTMKLETRLYWSKMRYFKDDEFEYYVEEKEKYFIELDLNLMNEELLLTFSEEEKNFLKDKNLTKGWYTSNKMPIDFSE